MYNVNQIEERGYSIKMSKIEASIVPREGEENNAAHKISGLVNYSKRKREILALIQQFDADESQAERQKELYKNMLNSLAKDDEEYEVTRKQLFTIMDYLSEITKKKKQMESELKEIDGQLVVAEPKYFNKKTCIENIRFLLAQKPVKLGDIEREAGVSPGYLSRLEKDSNTTDPSIEFLMVASKTLGVSLDTLINTKLNRITEAERALIHFLVQLKRDTDSDEMIWVGDSVEKLDQCKYADESSQPHPLYPFPDNPYGPVPFSYESLFFSEKIIRPTSVCYRVKLQGSDDEMYMMKVSEIKDGTPGNEFIEVYHVDSSWNVYPICNTLQVSAEISEAVESLYESAAISSTHVRLSEKTRSLIGNYLKSKANNT